MSSPARRNTPAGSAAAAASEQGHAERGERGDERPAAQPAGDRIRVGRRGGVAVTGRRGIRRLRLVVVVAVPVPAVGDHITDGDDGSRRLEIVFGLSVGGDLRPIGLAADALLQDGDRD